jgi:hypothetical protein
LPYWASSIERALSELSACTVTFWTEPFGNLIFAVYDGIAIVSSPWLSQLDCIAQLLVVDVDIFLRGRD